MDVWIDINGPKPTFEFDFSVTPMLIFNLQFGRNQESSYYLPEIGIRVVKVGSYNKKDKQWLQNAVPKEKVKEEKPVERKPIEVRVKPKDMI